MAIAFRAIIRASRAVDRFATPTRTAARAAASRSRMAAASVSTHPSVVVRPWARHAAPIYRNAAPEAPAGVTATAASFATPPAIPWRIARANAARPSPARPSTCAWIPKCIPAITSDLDTPVARQRMVPGAAQRGHAGICLPATAQETLSAVRLAPLRCGCGGRPRARDTLGAAHG